MLGPLAIGSSILAILSDDDDEDLDALAEKALLLQDKSILYRHLSGQEIRQFTSSLYDRFRDARGAERDVLIEAMKVFALSPFDIEDMRPSPFSDPTALVESREKAKEIAWIDADHVVEAKILVVDEIHGYLHENSATLLIPGTIVRVIFADSKSIDTPSARDWIDPQWHVDVLSDLPEIDGNLQPTKGLLSPWIDGPSIHHAY